MQDAVNHPTHYNQYEGFEVIDVAEQLVGPDGKSGFNLGNAFKYMARAGYKNPDKRVEDLEKAKFYIQREIDRIEMADIRAIGEKKKALPDFDITVTQVTDLADAFQLETAALERQAKLVRKDMAAVVELLDETLARVSPKVQPINVPH